MRVTNNLQFVITLIKKGIFMITLKVEKENSELKDCFLAPNLYSRGEKTIFDLKLAVLLLTLKNKACNSNNKPKKSCLIEQRFLQINLKPLIRHKRAMNPYTLLYLI